MSILLAISICDIESDCLIYYFLSTLSISNSQLHWLILRHGGSMQWIHAGFLDFKSQNVSHSYRSLSSRKHDEMYPGEALRETFPFVSQSDLCLCDFANDQSGHSESLQTEFCALSVRDSHSPCAQTIPMLFDAHAHQRTHTVALCVVTIERD